MLKIINEDLFSYSTWTGTNMNGEPCFRLTVTSSNKIVRLLESKDQQKGQRGYMGDAMAPTAPINRELLKLSAPDQNYNNYPMSMKVYDNEKGIPNVELRALTPDRDNRANIYLIAFPFNGFLKCIPESPLYRIYKGALVTSAKKFWFNDRKYKKVLYLIVEPNLNLFKPDHKYHQEKIDVTIEAYATFKDREKNYAESTSHDTMTVTFINGAGEYTVDMESEVLDGRVELPAEPDKQLWTTFRFIPKDQNGNPINNNTQPSTTVVNIGGARKDDIYRDKKKNRQPASYIQGNMRVTTNKHGIRKEIPLNRQDRPRDLDRMMRDAGVFDEPRDDGRYGGKGKKKNNRRK